VGEPEALRALEQAVENYIMAAGWADHVTTGWALVVDQFGYELDGTTTSGVGIVYRGGSMPSTQAIGMFILAADSVRRSP
jgi:hypothetical protein